MSNHTTAQSWDERWHAAVCLTQKCVAPVLSICGPSGSGKSTAVQALVAEHRTYIERTEQNPYLKGLFEGQQNFDAMANQMWFLDRVGDFIKESDVHLPIVLDQDPAAIVFVYARMFRDESLITDADYVELIERLVQLELHLQRWTSPREVLVLDARAEALHERVRQRRDASSTPDVGWFRKVRVYFQEFSQRLPKRLVLSTTDLSPAEVVAQARNLLERHARC